MVERLNIMDSPLERAKEMPVRNMQHRLLAAPLQLLCSIARRPSADGSSPDARRCLEIIGLVGQYCKAIPVHGNVDPSTHFWLNAIAFGKTAQWNHKREAEKANSIKALLTVVVDISGYLSVMPRNGRRIDFSIGPNTFEQQLGRIARRIGSIASDGSGSTVVWCEALASSSEMDLIRKQSHSPSLRE
jgi:hypothetical protein